jgi:hypothetical protein
MQNLCRQTFQPDGQAAVGRHAQVKSLQMRFKQTGFNAPLRLELAPGQLGDATVVPPW